MLLETLSTNLRLARQVNYTTNGYPTRIPQIAEPTGDAGTATGQAVIDLSISQGIPGQFTQNALKVVPFGIGSDTNTFSIWVIGWQRVIDPAGVLATLWIPTTLLIVQCAIDTTNPGIAGSVVSASNYFCDTITVTTGSTLSGEAAAENIISPTDSPGHFLVDLKGCQKVELAFTTGGSATSANALVSLL